MPRVLTVLSGPARGKQLSFEDLLAFQVGASARAHLVLDDPGVANIHLTLFFLDDACNCHDVSGRGFLLNGIPCTRAVLSDGDLIGVGGSTLRFSAAATPSPGATPVPGRDRRRDTRDLKATEMFRAYEVAELLESLATESDCFGPDCFVSPEVTAPPAPAARGGDTVVDLGAVDVGPWAALTVVHGDCASDFVELRAGATVLLGRCRSADVVLRDTRASRIHCRIDQEGSGFRLTDLDSSNGTHVNGEAVESRWLEHQDTIRIGSTCLRFVLVG